MVNNNLEKISINIPDSSKKRVVIVGGGFGGLALARKLRNKDFQVVLFDRHNYHTFQPLLYQVATAGLEPDSIAGPLRKFLEGKADFYFRMSEVQRIVPEQNRIETTIGSLSYDYLILANGSKTNFFGNEEKFTKAFPLKQIPQALDLRSHVLQNFEAATISVDPVERKQLMNFVIVGGGPTGVEVAGALGELKKHVLPHDYPELNLHEMNILLVEGMSRLLGGMTEEAGEKALQYLKKFNVETRLDTFVKSFDGECALLSNGEEIETNTVIWAAGVTGNIIAGLDETILDKGRIKVNRFHQAGDYKNIFVIGDLAFMSTEKYPQGHPMLAPVAIQQGKSLAANLIREQKGKKLKPFEFKDKGSMATVGRNRAVVDLANGFNFGGLLAWFAWMFIHLITLIGFRSKLVVFSNWVWNYFTYDRGTRLIIRPYVPPASNKKKTEEVAASV